MTRDDARSFTEHWDRILKEQEVVRPKESRRPTSFFTDTKRSPGGPNKDLVEGWRQIIDGAEDMDSDHRDITNIDRLAADEGDGLSNIMDFGPPPSGRAGVEPGQEVLNESEDHWQNLARQLKSREPKAPKGYLNTKDAASHLDMTPEHFLRCVWNIDEFVKPVPAGKGMAYPISEVEKVKEALPKDGFGKYVRGDKQMTKGNIEYETNPINFSSVGKDQNPPPRSDDESETPVRVSRFSKSSELDELGELRREIEVMQRRYHKSDTEQNKKKSEKLKKELIAMQKRAEKLSDAAQSQVDTDVT